MQRREEMEPQLFQRIQKVKQEATQLKQLNEVALYYIIFAPLLLSGFA